MSFLSVFKNEAKLIFSDAAIVLTILGGVILYAFLYPQPYAKQSVSGLALSVVDYDKTNTSRDLIFKLNASPQVNVVRKDMSSDDAKEALVKGKIKAILIIPPNFKRDLALGVSPTIAIGADASYFLIYGGVLEASMKAILTTSATIKVTSLLKKAMPLQEAKESYTSYSLNIINLFNKDNSYTQYVVPAVFVLILQQTLLIGLGILGGGINERKSNKESGYFNEAPVWMMMLSRTLIFGFIFSIHILFYFGFSFEYFEITRLASVVDLLTFSFVYLLAVIGFGIFLGTVFSCREIATPAVLFSSLPLVFSAGFVWPLEAVPELVQYISWLFPSTPAIEGFLALNQMGAEFEDVSEKLLHLTLLGFFYFTLSYYLLRKQKRSL